MFNVQFIYILFNASIHFDFSIELSFIPSVCTSRYFGHL